MSSICLALAKTSFSQGLFSIRRRVTWAIWLMYMYIYIYMYVYMTFSMCPPVKINQTSSQDSAKWKFTIQTFIWLLGCMPFLHVFFAAHFTCLSWFIFGFHFSCLVPSLRLFIIGNSFPQGDSLVKMVLKPPTNQHIHINHIGQPPHTSSWVEPPLSCHVIYRGFLK